jgi:cytochrome P450
MVTNVSMASAVNEGAVHWDPYDPRYFANPYPVFRRLREEAPFYYNEQYDFFAVSRYEDVVRTLGDRDTFISARGDILEFIKNNTPMPPGMFIYEDPPLHTIHRGILTRVFTPKKMNALEPQIRAFCANALDPLVAGGEFNFIDDLGAEMPMRIIGMLLGIPDEDLKKVQHFVDQSLSTEPGKPMDTSGASLGGDVYADYIDWRAKNPSNDLMTELLNVEFVDETGTTRKLRREEVLTFIGILAGAGNETTNRLIGWTGKTLAEHPDQRRQIHENRGLIPQAIEEILRFEPPGPAVSRYVARDTEFYGTKVPEGSAVVGISAAANRDERKFANGDSFDIHRERVPHLSFGYGFHNCLGNALARIEGRVALDEILKRFPDWEIDLDNARLSSTSSVRGWETLPAYAPNAKRGTRRPKAVAPETPAPVPAGAETWKMTLKTPMGPQEMTAHLIRQGDSLSGRVDSPAGSEAIHDGKVAGDVLTWILNVKKPMPIQLTFEVKVQGDLMTGSVKLGVFGSAELTGARVHS